MWWRVALLIAVLLFLSLFEALSPLDILANIVAFYGFIRSSRPEENNAYVLALLIKPSMFVIFFYACYTLGFFAIHGLHSELVLVFPGYVTRMVMRCIVGNYGGVMLWAYLNQAKIEHAATDPQRPQVVIGS